MIWFIDLQFLIMLITVAVTNCFPKGPSLRLALSHKSFPFSDQHIAGLRGSGDISGFQKPTQLLAKREAVGGVSLFVCS